jgi:hypothetical protein
MNIRSVVHLDKLLTLNLNQVLSGFGVRGGVAEAGKGHRPRLQGLYTQGFAVAAFGVMVAYRRVAFSHGDDCGERKGR